MWVISHSVCKQTCRKKEADWLVEWQCDSNCLHFVHEVRTTMYDRPAWLSRNVWWIFHSLIKRMVTLLHDKEVGQPTSLKRISDPIVIRFSGFSVHTQIDEGWDYSGTLRNESVTSTDCILPEVWAPESCWLQPSNRSVADALLIDQGEHHFSPHDKKVGRPTCLDKISDPTDIWFSDLAVHTQVAEGWKWNT